MVDSVITMKTPKKTKQKQSNSTNSLSTRSFLIMNHRFTNSQTVKRKKNVSEQKLLQHQIKPKYAGTNSVEKFKAENKQPSRTGVSFFLNTVNLATYSQQ